MRTWWRGRRLYAIGAAVVVVAAGVAVPVTLAESEEPCWSAPESVTRLVGDPGAATEALDPGEDLSRLDSVRKLLVHTSLCDPQDLGRVIESATIPAAGKPRTTAQARAAYAAAAAYDEQSDVPGGLEPFLARLLADYVVDAARAEDVVTDRPGGPTSPDDDTWFEQYDHPQEPHAAFAYRQFGEGPELKWLVGRLARDPKAFALLYDAERAYFAHCLERFDPRRLLIDEQVTKKEAPRKVLDYDVRWSLSYAADRIGGLMQDRVDSARRGEIEDLAAFDRAVRGHLKGTYEPAPDRIRTRPVMGDIARRPAAGPLRGDVMDGRHQLLPVLETWAASHDVPDELVARMRLLVDENYVRGMAVW
ncbi:hypothetical protein [Streptomyces sp. N35]|uniref:hypothetical protein n=1 Tax=Streptomyces sp. N35 TaxID=2795730 RepID=UPI0018F35D6F|nr:hypothetical protein [Streptomyces sp. N35]